MPPSADGGQTILGIGLILLSGASTVCLVILKSMFGQKDSNNGKYMPRTECEAWRHGISDQLRTLTSGQAALFSKVDDIHAKMFRGRED